MWDDAVASNEASWAASAARLKAKSLGVDANGFHAYLWLHTPICSRDATPMRVRSSIARSPSRESGSPRTAYHYLMARAAFIVETRRTDNLPPPLDAEERKRRASRARGGSVGRRAGRGASRGCRESGSDPHEAAGGRRRRPADRKRIILERPRRRRYPATAPAATAPTATATAMPISAADRAAIDIMTQQLTALVRCLRGDETEALAILTKAADAEDVMPYEFGPPVPVKPSRELLGEMLARDEQARRSAEGVRGGAAPRAGPSAIARRPRHGGREERRHGSGCRRQGGVEGQLESRGRGRSAPRDPTEGGLTEEYVPAPVYG